MKAGQRIKEEGYDHDVYENVWLPVGDDKNVDIERLIEQGRITAE
jgi:hypothetical protein